MESIISTDKHRIEYPTRISINYPESRAVLLDVVRDKDRSGYRENIYSLYTRFNFPWWLEVKKFSWFDRYVMKSMIKSYIGDQIHEYCNLPVKSTGMCRNAYEWLVFTRGLCPDSESVVPGERDIKDWNNISECIEFLFNYIYRKHYGKVRKAMAG